MTNENLIYELRHGDYGCAINFLMSQVADLIEQQQQRITELEAQLREVAKANHLIQLIGEQNAFRRVSAMNVDGWLKQKMQSEIERVACRIEEIKKDRDHG